MSEEQNQSLVVQRDFSALSGSHYKSLPNGILFEVDEKGVLVMITRDELQGLITDVKQSLSDTERIRERTRSADNWWVGDTGGALKTLYGDEAVASFAEQIEMPIEQVNKWISVSKAFGFPNKITEMRHPDPDVSHAHHQKVQGFKDLTQRMNLLQEASDEKLSVSKFYERIKQMKAGPGADPNPNPDELGVFRPAFRVYDKKTDNPEQFLQEFNEFVKNQYFPEYINPELRLARETQEKREKMADKLPSEFKTKVLLEAGHLPIEEFEKVVNKLAAQTQDRKKIETELSRIKDETIRAEAAEKIKVENLNLEGAKTVIKHIKDEAKSRKQNADKIEKLIGKIKNEAKRSEIFDLVARERLLITQVEPMVNEIISDELIEESAAKLRKQNEERTESQIQKRADAIRQKQLEPREKKPTASAKSTAELPLGKKAAPKKKAASKQPSTEV